jgi:hypothetical protein
MIYLIFPAWHLTTFMSGIILFLRREKDGRTFLKTQAGAFALVSSKMFDPCTLSRTTPALEGRKS